MESEVHLCIDQERTFLVEVANGCEQDMRFAAPIDPVDNHRAYLQARTIADVLIPLHYPPDLLNARVPPQPQVVRRTGCPISSILLTNRALLLLPEDRPPARHLRAEVLFFILLREIRRVLEQRSL